LDATLAPIFGQVLGKNTWTMVDNELIKIKKDLTKLQISNIVKLVWKM
jgi:hypothetical protein